jgi:S1-C subfamily serine protease
MKTEVRVRPWHLALISLSGGAIGALVFAALTPARIESQMDGAIPSFAALAQEVMPAVVNINTTKNILPVRSAASTARPGSVRAVLQISGIDSAAGSVEQRSRFAS